MLLTKDIKLRKDNISILVKEPEIAEFFGEKLEDVFLSNDIRLKP